MQQRESRCSLVGVCTESPEDVPVAAWTQPYPPSPPSGRMYCAMAAWALLFLHHQTCEHFLLLIVLQSAQSLPLFALPSHRTLL